MATSSQHHCDTDKAVNRSTKQAKDGFDCEFIERPPVIQSECPVCLKILCEPYQISCCGNSFCQVCIERIKVYNKPCPTCNEVNFATFHDKRLQHSLYGFQVYCSHKQEGCEWKGELGHLDNHLNLSPQPNKQLQGCEYSEIECNYCSELIKRSNITVHQEDVCPKRPFSCEHCHSYESHYEDVVNNHWPVCGYHPVQCPNECGISPKHQALEEHIAKDCPKTIIDCNFHRIGCDVKLTRKDMPAHLNENLVTHMSLQVASYSKLLASHTVLRASHRAVQDKVNKLESENETLKDQLETSQRENQKAATRMHELVNKLEHTLGNKHGALMIQLETTQEENQQVVSRAQEMKQQITTLELSSEAESSVLQQIARQLKIQVFNTVDLIMQEYNHYMLRGNTWFSRPFYTHPRGYKVCLRVDANGTSAHVSVFICLMRGEFDDHLTWPFQGEIIIQLLSQKGNAYRQTVLFTNRTSIVYTGRVREGERNDGWGKTQFISQDVLVPNYLKNDCLHFRITCVKIRI